MDGVLTERTLNGASNRRQCAASAVILITVFTCSEVRLCEAQTAAPSPISKPARVEKLGPDTLRVGNVRIDTARKEISVKGVVTDANILEFIAATKGGRKAYESALELETNAFDFNLGLILIGLDQSRSVVPKMHLDPAVPLGDPLEIWVEWDQPGGRRKIRAEQLVYNTHAKSTLPEGSWVYTGSLFSAQNGAYLAEVQGTLIGFVHSPSCVIDSPRPLSPGTYGNDVINPALNLKAGMAVEVIVRALPRAR